MIETGYFWSAVALLAVGTLLIRFSIIAVSDRFEITERLREVFSYIPAAIIPAIVVPMVFFHKGSVEWLAGKERLFVVVLAAVVCWFTRNMLATIIFGLLALYLLTHVI